MQWTPIDMPASGGGNLGIITGEDGILKFWKVFAIPVAAGAYNMQIDTINEWNYYFIRKFFESVFFEKIFSENTNSASLNSLQTDQ